MRSLPSFPWDPSWTGKVLHQWIPHWISRIWECVPLPPVTPRLLWDPSWTVRILPQRIPEWIPHQIPGILGSSGSTAPSGCPHWPCVSPPPLNWIYKIAPQQIPERIPHQIPGIPRSWGSGDPCRVVPPLIPASCPPFPQPDLRDPSAADPAVAAEPLCGGGTREAAARADPTGATPGPATAAGDGTALPRARGADRPRQGSPTPRG